MPAVVSWLVAWVSGHHGLRIGMVSGTMRSEILKYCDALEGQNGVTGLKLGMNVESTTLGERSETPKATYRMVALTERSS